MIDLPRLRRNIRRLADHAASVGVRVRPHLKTHKCPEIMRLQIDAGAEGVTVATLHEAETFAAAGARDIVVSFPPVGDWRLERIARLAESVRVVVACSDVEHVLALASLGRRRGRIFKYYWEVDSGTGRLGTTPGEETAEVLARLSSRSARLAGLMTFPGHSYRATSRDELERIAVDEARALEETAACLRDLGVDPGVLSGGSTPTGLLREGKQALDEIRCGNYVFFDATQVALGIADVDECALRVEASVVGRPASDRIVLDAGSKAVPPERLHPASASLGLVPRHPDLVIESLYEEHAVCRSSAGQSALEIGDRVSIVPNHACTCANLHERYLVRDGEEREEVWAIPARGW